ncbi:hypothetical protein KC343_g3496 [Hortaea werneckii]|uniref:Uncharacterized protein n=1 Tax=Hortaea werneckii TaxID=91943 RepID=A0A3M7FAK3_HORWE|nr:hypothetical protein KC338_g6676 [Hortaea werneckii]KAI7265528.1 hypothetical protein KC352_g9039 [Hortaea werneckii]KAI7568512.1 hypothetical protein KC317_g4125 [Hortaea werneckii]KAI7625689.1 hypothetical protein KC346_g1617 [Hortaea werneckii]KAI7632398.1 hypothetical protein KC343_g3496 [Hortaea werneckii]
MKDRKEDIEVRLRSSDTGVEYHETASASEFELTKECHIRVWPRQKYAFAINVGAAFDFEGASDLCIGFRTDGGDVRYGKTLKSRTSRHRYNEAHVYADATLIGDEVSRTEFKVLPFEFIATDGVLRGKLEVILQRGKETNRDFLEMLSPNLAKSPKARIRDVLTSVAYTPHEGKSHVSRGPYQPERFHWTPSKGDSGRELKFIFNYSALLDAEKAKAAKKLYIFTKVNSFEQGVPASLAKEPTQLLQTKLASATPTSQNNAFKWARASGLQTPCGLQEDCDDEESMPTKRIKTEPTDHEAFEKAPDKPTSVFEYSTKRITGNSVADLRMRREREKKKAEIKRQLREIELERKLAELDD